MAREYQSKGINFIAISSNDINAYPQDAPELMTQLAAKEKFIFPYLYDETQAVAKAYGATCTPDIYLYNGDLRLAYHGQLDDSRPGNGLVCDGNDLANAITDLLTHRTTTNQKPSVGVA